MHFLNSYACLKYFNKLLARCATLCLHTYPLSRAAACRPIQENKTTQFSNTGILTVSISMHRIMINSSLITVYTHNMLHFYRSRNIFVF